MIGWNESYNWTREQTLNAVRGKTQVVLCCEHNSYDNMLEMVEWLDEAGYIGKIPDDRERIIVDRKVNGLKGDKA